MEIYVFGKKFFVASKIEKINLQINFSLSLVNPEISKTYKAGPEQSEVKNQKSKITFKIENHIK